MLLFSRVKVKYYFISITATSAFEWFLLFLKLCELNLIRSLMNCLLTTFVKHIITYFQNSSHDALIRSFQMALSLRDISLMEGGELPHVFDPLSTLKEKNKLLVSLNLLDIC